MALMIGLSFLYGTLIGSFLNVLILRLPRRRSLGGRSACPTCKSKLTAIELIPLVSYVALRGKCRSCHTPISPRYFIIELATGALFALAAYVINPGVFIEYLSLLRVWLIIAVLIAVFVIDLKHFLILDKVIFPASIVVFVLNVILDFGYGNSFFSWSSLSVGGLAAALFPCAFFFALWYLSRGKWIGFGDVKYMIFLGVALTWPTIWAGLFVAFVLGGIVGTGLLAFGNKTMQSKLPLGTFLSVGALIGLLWGHQLLQWYLGFIGVA